MVACLHQLQETGEAMSAKDGRLYGKFTLDFADHPKILPLSDAAFRCLVEATLWSRKQQTDGWLASRLALARWSLEALNELCTNDTDNPSLIASESGWLIRDFAEHQDTKAEIEARRERAIAAGQRGGLARAKRTAKQPAKQTASKSLSKTQAETETETHKEPPPNGDGSLVVITGGVTNGEYARIVRNGADAPPPTTCHKHPEGNSAAPCRVCAAIRERDTKNGLNVDQQRAQREHERNEWERLIGRCELCGDNGMVFSPGPHGERNPHPAALYVRCPHNVRDRRKILDAHGQRVADVLAAEQHLQPTNNAQEMSTW
jgi:hypothetical protein